MEDFKMTDISVYNDDADTIEELSEEYGLSVAEVVRVLLQYADEAAVDGEFG